MISIIMCKYFMFITITLKIKVWNYWQNIHHFPKFMHTILTSMCSIVFRYQMTYVIQGHPTDTGNHTVPVKQRVNKSQGTDNVATNR